MSYADLLVCRRGDRKVGNLLFKEVATKAKTDEAGQHSEQTCNYFSFIEKQIVSFLVGHWLFQAVSSVCVRPCVWRRRVCVFFVCLCLRVDFFCRTAVVDFVSGRLCAFAR